MGLGISFEYQDFPIEKRSVFASPAWVSAFDGKASLLGIGDRNNTKAVFQILKYRKLGKTVLINTPFSSHCGLSIEFNSEKIVTRNSDVKHIVRAIGKYINSNFSGAYVDLGLPPEIRDVQPFLQNDFEVAIAYTYRLGLSPSEKELLANCSTERRKNIRDAIKKEYEITIHSGNEASFDLLKDTYTKAGLHFDNEALKKILKTESAFCVYVALPEELIAVAVIAFDKHIAYYISGGTTKTAGHEGASALALWNAIAESKKRGIEIFDFCGSSVPEIEKFFRGFGGDLIPYFRIRKNYKIFDLLRKTKAKLS